MYRVPRIPWVPTPKLSPTCTNVELSVYLTDVRRLLKDANSQFWTDAALTDYINEGLRKTVADTGPLRSLITVPLVAQQEVYTLPTLSVDPGSGVQVLQSFDMLNLSIQVQSYIYNIPQVAFTELNARWRVFTNFYRLPEAYAQYGQKNFYLGPIPDQAYPSEWDTYVPPATLIAATDDDGLMWPYTDPVKYYAAYLAQLERQRRDISQDMLALYIERASSSIGETHYLRGGKRLSG